MGQIIRMREAEAGDGIATAREAYHALQNSGSSAECMYEDDVFLGALALADATLLAAIRTDVQEGMAAVIELALMQLTCDGRYVSPGVTEWMQARAELKHLDDAGRAALSQARYDAQREVAK